MATSLASMRAASDRRVVVVTLQMQHAVNDEMRAVRRERLALFVRLAP